MNSHFGVMFSVIICLICFSTSVVYVCSMIPEIWSKFYRLHSGLCIVDSPGIDVVLLRSHGTPSKSGLSLVCWFLAEICLIKCPWKHNLKSLLDNSLPIIEYNQCKVQFQRCRYIIIITNANQNYYVGSKLFWMILSSRYLFLLSQQNLIVKSHIFPTYIFDDWNVLKTIYYVVWFFIKTLGRCLLFFNLFYCRYCILS